MRILAASACLLAALVVPAGTGHAQSKFAKDSIKNCEKATKTVEKERPRHKQAEAIVTLLGCGSSAAPLFAQAIADTRTEADTTALGSFYRTANEWRDAGMMNAAVGVASDRTATTPARVFAITHLLRLLSPRMTYSYTAIVQRSRSETADRLVPCIPYSAGTHADPPAAGAPLPANYESTLATELFRIADDATAPVEVRYAAACSGRLPPG